MNTDYFTTGIMLLRIEKRLQFYFNIYRYKIDLYTVTLFLLCKFSFVSFDIYFYTTVFCRLLFNKFNKWSYYVGL